jgi:hypothetical protein
MEGNWKLWIYGRPGTWRQGGGPGGRSYTAGQAIRTCSHGRRPCASGWLSKTSAQRMLRGYDGRDAMIPRARFTTLLLTLLVAACEPQSLVVVFCPDKSAENCPPGDGGFPDAGDGPASTLRRGLVGHWRLDEGPGSTVVIDSSPHRNHGTLVGVDPSTAWVQGHIEGALNIAGMGFVSIPPSASIDAIAETLTVAGWIYWTDTLTGLFATAISRQKGTTEHQHYHLSIAFAGQPSFLMYGPGNHTYPIGPDPVAMNTWVHLAGTYDGSTARLYVDGVLIQSQTLGSLLEADSTPLILGANGNFHDVDERFAGYLDEIVLYNRALDDTEIAALAAGAQL